MSILIMEVLTLLFCLLVVVLGYIYLKWKYSYWKRIGLDYLEPELFYGNTRDLASKNVSVGDQFDKLYRELKGRGYKHGGIFTFLNPVYMPVDLDLLKDILIKDFDHFVNHGTYYNEEVEPLSGHLFNLEDDKWRRLRAKMTPTFTSGKIKMMSQTMFDCAVGLKKLLSSYAVTQDAVDIKEVLARYTTDVIGSTAFGLDFDSLGDSESKFRENGRKLFNTDLLSQLRQLAQIIIPKPILRAINFKIFDSAVRDFFTDVVKKTIDYRETNNIYRKDFMHLMLQLKNRGKITDDEFVTKQKGEKDGDDFITFNELAAQCLIFFMAGFETSATTMTFILFEMALNNDIQENLRREIKSVLEKYNGELTYEAIKEMKYLDKVVYETLRKHSPTPALPRVCNKSYKVPGTNVVIRKGTQLIIPISAIHHDPDNYPDPKKFDPERFSEENKAKRHPCAFLSFGEGPRYCLGSRFGLLQTKVGIITVLNNFRVNLHEKTQLPVKCITTNFILAVEGGVWLTVSKID